MKSQTGLRHKRLPSKVFRKFFLPNPEFECEEKKLVSSSSNNYLALAHDLRMIAAARKGLEMCGVANCESIWRRFCT